MNFKANICWSSCLTTLKMVPKPPLPIFPMILYLSAGFSFLIWQASRTTFLNSEKGRSPSVDYRVSVRSVLKATSGNFFWKLGWKRLSRVSFQVCGRPSQMTYPLFSTRISTLRFSCSFSLWTIMNRVSVSLRIDAKLAIGSGPPGTLATDGRGTALTSKNVLLSTPSSLGF